MDLYIFYCVTITLFYKIKIGLGIFYFISLGYIMGNNGNQLLAKITTSPNHNNFVTDCANVNISFEKSTTPCNSNGNLIMQKSRKKMDKYSCEICDYKTDDKFNYDKHILTPKHENLQKLQEKNSQFSCTACNFITNNRTNYSKHILTAKHMKITIDEIKTKHVCLSCKKHYKYASGLSRHKRLVHQNTTQENMIVPSDNELIKMVMEENAKLHAAMKEQSAAIQALIPHVGNNNNNTTNNKKFNINIFLNETCKDAINMKDFIKNIQITLKDVMHAAENGVLSSSRNLVLKGLQDMEITTRPIHCTDVKRNTMYIKDKGAWNKDQDNEELKKTMQCVSTKHVKAIKEWEAANPNYMASDKGQQEYIRIVQKITQSVVQSKRDMQSTIKNVAEETHLNT